MAMSSTVHRRITGNDLSRLLRFADPIVLTILFLRLEPAGHWISGADWMPRFWGLVVLWSTIFLPRFGIYESYRNQSLFTLVRRITASWLTLLLIMYLFSKLSNIDDSLFRLAFSSWSLNSWLWLLSAHLISRFALRRYRLQGGDKRSIMFWGSQQEAQVLSHHISSHKWTGFYISAWFSPVEADTAKPDSDFLPSCKGSVSSLGDWLSENHVDRIVFSDRHSSDHLISKLLEIFGDTSIPVYYFPHWSASSMQFTVSSLGDQPCIKLWGHEKALLDRQLKRAVDIVLSIILAFLLSPLLLVIAIGVRLSSPGPILFAQNRYGVDGRKFKCFKFRSMYVDLDCDSVNLKQATLGDPRVTPFGRIIRKSSLDELPQLLNVIIGNMSLVGPRPHAVQHNELYRSLIPGYMQRHACKPGITGLAQVNGLRGEILHLSDMEKRIDADLAYQRDWSLKLDVKILFKTLLAFGSPKAY